jgi:hypothetical protein
VSVFNYNKYINEKLILENLRDMRFVLSKKFINALSKVDHVISDELLKLHNDLDSETRQTFIDIHKDKDDVITFIQANKASEILNIEDQEAYDQIDKSILDKLDRRHKVYKNNRVEMKLGRFINTIFGNGTFPNSARTPEGEKPKDVESFVRIYRSLHNQSDKFKLFDIVKGDKIAYWYKYDNYKNSNGTMGGSCMAEVSSYYFNIYVQNPDQISMLILYSDSSKTKIEGRALIWQLLLPENRIFMERAYTNDSSKEELFKEYAKKNGWLHKKNQSYGYDVHITDTVDGTSGRKHLRCQLTEKEFETYPFIDTMQFYNNSTGILSNKKRGMNMELTSTGGDYNSMDDYYDESNYVHSNYHNDDYPESEVKWCDYGQDWVEEDVAIRVFNSGGKFAVPGNPGVVCMDIPSMDIKKHFPKEKTIWSDLLNTWVFKDASRKVWTNRERTTWVRDYKKRQDETFVKIGRICWHIDLVRKNESTGQWELIN